MGLKQQTQTSDTEEKVFLFPNWSEWDKWLKTNQNKSNGVWLKIAKKNSGENSIIISDALDTGLCYGWIDSQRKKFDDKFYIQRYSPRGKKSPWSKLNVERAERLIKSKRMKKNGFAEIEKAKEDGRWNAAYESQKEFKVPKDFKTLLDKNSKAKKIFNSLDKTKQYGIVLPVLKATTPEARKVLLQKALNKLK